MTVFIDNFIAKDYYDMSFEIENAISNHNDISINAKDAGWLRSAISRAYYSAFLSLKQEFLNNPTLKSKIKNLSVDHGNIYKEMQKLPANLYYLAKFFDDLRTARKNADYDFPPKYEIDPTQVNTANKKALKVLNNIQTIMQNL